MKEIKKDGKCSDYYIKFKMENGVIAIGERRDVEREEKGEGIVEGKIERKGEMHWGEAQ